MAAREMPVLALLLKRTFEVELFRHAWPCKKIYHRRLLQINSHFEIGLAVSTVAHQKSSVYDRGRAHGIRNATQKHIQTLRWHWRVVWPCNVFYLQPVFRPYADLHTHARTRARKLGREDDGTEVRIQAVDCGRAQRT